MCPSTNTSGLVDPVFVPATNAQWSSTNPCSSSGSTPGSFNFLMKSSPRERSAPQAPSGTANPSDCKNDPANNHAKRLRD
eukprot:5475191-Amphidinium_carterae.1